MTNRSPDTNPPDPSVLWRPRHLSKRWDTSIRTLQRMRSCGKGPAWMKIGGSVFYWPGDVLAYEEAMRRGGGDGHE